MAELRRAVVPEAAEEALVARMLPGQAQRQTLAAAVAAAVEFKAVR
jgi:hypothetical protein